ncbi:hypothetical protein [Oscillatoria acuminata]|uniref:hypothetical protein n=1 Tax=Oscillatoria acuminata TaxID=118323 RepID=UPI000309F431|nr:hypothetical protein [Oscillatoria acuminata]
MLGSIGDICRRSAIALSPPIPLTICNSPLIYPRSDRLQLPALSANITVASSEPQNHERYHSR